MSISATSIAASIAGSAANGNVSFYANIFRGGLNVRF